MKPHVDAFLINILSAAVWAVLMLVGARFLPVLLRKRWSVLPLALLAVFGAAFNVLTLVLAPKGTVYTYIAAALIFTVSLVAPLLFIRELYKLWRTGISGADQSIQDGLNYTQALCLCKSQLSFLGTGAAKLTQEPEFEAAMLRCRTDVPVRFLLASPEGENLKKAARRAGRSEHAFRDIVLGSLRVLSGLKINRGVNIEVRFYLTPPVWRLMFIDRKMCLVSYNVFGEGSGSQLPQLHIAKARDDYREVDSFYYPFEIYFEQIWSAAQPWDFTSFL